MHYYVESVDKKRDRCATHLSLLFHSTKAIGIPNCLKKLSFANTSCPNIRVNGMR